MIANRAIVWVFDSHTAAEANTKQLQSQPFDMMNSSIVGKDDRTSGAAKETN